MRLSFFLILLFLFSSCSWFDKDKKKETSKVIAKVEAKILFEKDMSGMFKGTLTKQDSELLRRSFINNWVKEQLIYQKALSNLTDKEKDKKDELEEYYRSLIKYEYLNKIVQQRLDKNVTDTEIEVYYENNKEIFLLHKCLVKLIYVAMPLTSKDIKLLKRWFVSDKKNDRDFLYEYCVNKSVRSNLDPEKWFYFDELGKEIPTKSFDCNNITPNNYYEMTDSNNIYMLNFTEIKHGGSNYSPLKFEKDRIRNIILYKRRLDMIKVIENEVYKEGVQKNYFKIYD